MSSIFKNLDNILDNEHNTLTKRAILAIPITREEVFNRIKPMLVGYLTNPKVLIPNNIECVPVPEDNDASKYFYFFEKTKPVPTREKIEKFLFAVADLLGKTNLDDNDFYVNKAREYIYEFVDHGWAKIVEDSNKILKDAKLDNLLLLIRLADHDRQTLLRRRDDVERSGSKRRINYAQNQINRYDAMKSIVGKDKYFDVDDTLDSLSFLLDGGIERLSGAKRVIRDFRNNLRKLMGKDIYDLLV